MQATESALRHMHGQLTGCFTMVHAVFSSSVEKLRCSGISHMHIERNRRLQNPGVDGIDQNLCAMTKRRGMLETCKPPPKGLPLPGDHHPPKQTHTNTAPVAVYDIK